MLNRYEEQYRNSQPLTCSKSTKSCITLKDECKLRQTQRKNTIEAKNDQNMNIIKNDL